METLGTDSRCGLAPRTKKLFVRSPGSASLGRVVAFVCLLSLVPTAAISQGLYGKNKIQYEARDWFVLRTPHAEIFFYPEEEDLAREVAAIAESACVEFDSTFNLTLSSPIPILLYSSHQDFQQTNAARGLISEGVGGLTELLKGRVLLPHTGSRHRLIWVTRHELVHAYMLIKLGQVLRENKKYRYSMPPLWFIEGLAEFVSTKWDSQAEGLLQDAVVSNRAYPMTESGPITGTVLMYKEGQSFLDYLAEKHSRQDVLNILENWAEAENFEAVFQYTFGQSLESADREWFAWLKTKYYPCISTCYWTDEQARQITRGNSYDLAPTVYDAPSDTSFRFFYLSASNGATDLMMGIQDGEVLKKERLIRGGFSSQFESFHLFRSQLGVSSSGLVALVSQRGGRDVLHIYDGNSRKLLSTWAPSALTGLSSPTWLAGDTSLVVSGQRGNGQNDLFLINALNGKTRELTDDFYDEQDPTAHPDGGSIVFSSDRDGGREGYLHLYEIELESGEIRRLTSGMYSDRDPMWSPDGTQLVFVSDRDRINDLYLYRDGNVRRISHFLGPANSPSWLPDGKSILFGGQNRLTFYVYQMMLDEETVADTAWVEQPVDSALLAWDPIEPHAEPAQEYTRRFGLDIAQNGVSLDPTLGAAGAGQFALSDLLGNEAIYFFLANDSESIGNFLDGMEVGLTYWNQSRRMNFGVGVFRLTRLYDPALDLVRRERRIGGSLTASYPLSKFNRIEASFVLRYAQDHLIQRIGFADVWLASNFLTYVRDNSRWTMMGPSGGMRFNISAGYTRDLTTGLGDFFTVRMDARRYLELSTRLVSATRLNFQSSFGNDPQLVYIGGRFSLRGWPRRTLPGTQALVLQQEFRFPLWRRLRLGVPSAWEFPPIQGALFVDVAAVGNMGRRIGKAGTLGAGMYIGGGFYPAIRLDFMRRFDENQIYNNTIVQFSFMFNY